MARILIADENAFLRIGIRKILQARDGFEICAEAACVEEAVGKVRTMAPDLVVLGQLSAGDTASNLAALRGAAGDKPILLLDRETSSLSMQRAFELGASGVLLVSDSDESLFEAFAALERREKYVSRGLRGRAVTGRAARNNTPQLTARELEVLRLIVGGKRTAEISQLLGITRKTVESHRGALMRKLNLHRLADVVRFAIHNGLSA